VAEAVPNVWERRGSIRVCRVDAQPRAPRHFTARFAGSPARPDALADNLRRLVQFPFRET
jgi:hypothetical protein